MINPNISEPDLTAALDQTEREVMNALNCHLWGTIVSFDADKQTATVRINFQRVVYNQPPGPSQAIQPLPQIYNYPQLLDCPVFVLSGGGGVITMPVAAGDPCLVLFHDRDMDLWATTGNVVPPNTRRLHDLSDGMVIVGFRPVTQKLSDYSTTDIEIKNLGGLIGVAEKIAVQNDATSLLATLLAVMDTLTAVTTALTALNSVKTGGSAAAPIALVTAAIALNQAEINSLLK